MFALKPFQENAVAQLKEKFLTLWKLGDSNLSLTFKSPTGSGKTIMMAQFLRDIVADPRFQNADVGFLWITNSDSLAMQSKDKLFAAMNNINKILKICSVHTFPCLVMCE